MRMHTDELNIEKILKECDAFWIHSGNKQEPHVLLTNGLHSNGYFNINRITAFPNIRRLIASRMVSTMERIGINNLNVDVIISSSYAALQIGQAVADEFGIMSVFTEKRNNRQAWTGRFEIPKGARVLQVEELITSIKTTRDVRNAVLKVDPSINFVEHKNRKIVFTIVYRPSEVKNKREDYKIFSLCQKLIQSWKAEDCPLCKKGSNVVKPKSNWSKE